MLKKLIKWLTTSMPKDLSNVAEIGDNINFQYGYSHYYGEIISIYNNGKVIIRILNGEKEKSYMFGKIVDFSFICGDYQLVKKKPTLHTTNLISNP